MNNPIAYIRRSLPTKLSIWIVFFATLIFIVSLGFMFTQSLKVVRQEAVSRATQVLDNTVLRIDKILNRVEIAADNTEWLINRHLETPDSMFTYSRQILQNYPDLNGCSIAFEPDYYKDKGKGLYFSAYSYNDNGNIITTQEGNDHYVYFYMDWYQMVKLLLAEVAGVQPLGTVIHADMHDIVVIHVLHLHTVVIECPPHHLIARGIDGDIPVIAHTVEIDH